MAAKFKKGQVVNTLWRAFTERDEVVPPAFSAKIKKLAELGVPLTDGERPGQPGVDSTYTSYQAFELGVALKLLDAGFKQGEAAIFVKHVRQDLRQAYSAILANPPVGGGLNIFAMSRPNGPRQMVIEQGTTELADRNRHKLVDTSYWMTVRSLEFPQVLNPRAKKGELRFEPQFHRGLEELTLQMQHLVRYRVDNHRFVLELSNLAVMITQLLPEIPPPQRGRQ
jgi:hypothetical protein